jgi:hypothetical protein
MRPLTCILVVGERTTLLYYSVGPGGLEPLPIKDEIYSLAAVSERLSVPNFCRHTQIRTGIVSVSAIYPNHLDDTPKLITA